MRTRTIRIGIAASAASLAAVAGFAAPAGAATTDMCGESATVSVGVPDLFTGSLLGSNPLALNLPVLGPQDTFTGPSCTVSVSGNAYLNARLSAFSTAGVIAGTMTVTSYLPSGAVQQTVTCGPSYLSCQGSTQVQAVGAYLVTARCSVSGVVAVLTSVSCGLSPL